MSFGKEISIPEVILNEERKANTKFILELLTAETLYFEYYCLIILTIQGGKFFHKHHALFPRPVAHLWNRIYGRVALLTPKVSA